MILNVTKELAKNMTSHLKISNLEQMLRRKTDILHKRKQFNYRMN